MNARLLIEQLLATAAIDINGRASYDIQVNDERLYKRVLNEGSIGLGEAYMDGWWDCKQPDEFLYRILKADLDKKVKSNIQSVLLAISAKIFNRQSVKRAFNVAKKHYNLGNDLFEHMLDPYMQYSCAYWKNASTLDQAQEQKLDLICRKLKLSTGLSVLDIGCGWGGFAQYAAQNYGVTVQGITISTAQAQLAAERCAGLPVTISIQDYRSIDDQFDRIVSIGMFEHVGPKNYQSFMHVAHRNLKDNGIFLLHTIGGTEEEIATDPWIDRYIFPNGVIPVPHQLCLAFDQLFILQDWHNFGHYYDQTLMAWLSRFKLAWPMLKNEYQPSFYRMWEYYLSICAAAFRAEKNHLWQIVLTKKNYNMHYESVR
uniref:cyclopropane fatty acyl phospholipid synthase n=1 Tax=Pedobacter schmidteae TaxID=2201271 RepID=UPI000EAB9403|nr:cyclopropane fatty acyl phospholipid synthase [Pedobacter schmidteae]